MPSVCHVDISSQRTKRVYTGSVALNVDSDGMRNVHASECDDWT
jgi:hypothetical protein